MDTELSNLPTREDFINWLAENKKRKFNLYINACVFGQFIDAWYGTEDYTVEWDGSLQVGKKHGRLRWMAPILECLRSVLTPMITGKDVLKAIKTLDYLDELRRLNS